MKTTFIPPFPQISPAQAAFLPMAAQLHAAVNHNAKTLGTPAWPSVPAAGAPIVASGHQAWFWHPGILIKDLTAATIAQQQKGCAFHIVVDHDEHAACNIDVPVQNGNRLTVKQLILGREKPGLSSLDQPCIDLEAALSNIRAFTHENPSAAAFLENLKSAIQSVHHDTAASLIKPENLAHQVTAILDRLRRAIGCNLPVLFASQLAATSAFSSLLEKFLADAMTSVNAYNAAVQKHPQAGIAPLLIVDPDEMVEAPFWVMAAHGQKPIARVKAFAARQADGNWAITDSQGNPVDPTSRRLLPRALTMTALLRSQACHLFIHGKGGGQYDLITEAWCRQWISDQPLAPMAVASADLYLPFSVPSATPADVRAARWESHNLPHNIDRRRPTGSLQVIEKGQVLAQMRRTSDATQRARLFQRLHQLNAELAAQFPDLAKQVARNLQNALDGVANAQTLKRRDWCFAFYPPDQLKALAPDIGG